MKIYDRHTQNNAIDFMDYVIEKFPFRINMVRTDRGDEFQVLLHWHLADRGFQHAYIQLRTPQLNGKVERSHRTNMQEFYQLLNYKDDVDLEEKRKGWENFYIYHRPYGAFDGKTPYEALREKLKGETKLNTVPAVPEDLTHHTKTTSVSGFASTTSRASATRKCDPRDSRQPLAARLGCWVLRRD